MPNQMLPYSPQLRQLSRQLRKQMTFGEILFWQRVQRRQLNGFQFHRQVPVLDYIVNFYCHELRLAVAIDGNSNDQRKAEDHKQDVALAEIGITTIRFSEEEVVLDSARVAAQVRAWIESRHSNLS